MGALVISNKQLPPAFPLNWTSSCKYTYTSSKASHHKGFNCWV